MSFFFPRRAEMPTAETALPGRDKAIPVRGTHTVLRSSTSGPWPDGTEVLYVAMGCFWGSERIFWRLPGVVSTAVGYMGGFTPNPSYEETCTGRTGHTEAVLIAYDPTKTDAEQLLKAFWENHDPTQGQRQGNDVGSQYRSAIYWTTPGQEAAATATRDAFQQVLTANGLRADHHRTALGRRRRAVLLRRGLPPAVPGQESRWLLQPRPERDDVPDRSAAAGPAALAAVGATAGRGLTRVRPRLGGG